MDELGFVPPSKTGAEMLFGVFSQHYERTSTLVTSNLPFAEWTEVLGSERLTGALLDRLTRDTKGARLQNRNSSSCLEPCRAQIGGSALFISRQKAFIPFGGGPLLHANS